MSKNEQICQLLGVSKMQLEAGIHQLALGNYLADSLIHQAIQHLDTAQPFANSPADIIQFIQQARDEAHHLGETGQLFNAARFLETLCANEILTITDLLEIVDYLMQTAFDRTYGKERDQLTGASWMLKHKQQFLDNSRTLGFIEASNHIPFPSTTDFTAVAIMGAGSFRLRERMEYFLTHRDSLKGEIFLLTGERPLSLGLDSREVILAVAEAQGIQYDKQAAHPFKKGAHNREYLDSAQPVTESMMANYFWLQLNRQPSIDPTRYSSDIEPDHWRATTKSSAKDLANWLSTQLETQKMSPQTRIQIAIIVEQPFTQRMALQIQHTLVDQLTQAGFTNPVSVYGFGHGIDVEAIDKLSTAQQGNLLARINSAQAAWFHVKVQHAMAQLSAHHAIRDPDSYQFSTREKYYQHRCQEQEMIDYLSTTTLLSFSLAMMIKMDPASSNTNQARSYNDRPPTARPRTQTFPQHPSHDAKRSAHTSTADQRFRPWASLWRPSPTTVHRHLLPTSLATPPTLGAKVVSLVRMMGKR